MQCDKRSVSSSLLKIAGKIKMQKDFLIIMNFNNLLIFTGWIMPLFTVRGKMPSEDFVIGIR
jgi:hypothetical protein